MIMLAVYLIESTGTLNIFIQNISHDFSSLQLLLPILLFVMSILLILFGFLPMIYVIDRVQSIDENSPVSSVSIEMIPLKSEVLERTQTKPPNTNINLIRHQPNLSKHIQEEEEEEEKEELQRRPEKEISKISNLNLKKNSEYSFVYNNNSKGIDKKKD